jgi:hypothetical protein
MSNEINRIQLSPKAIEAIEGAASLLASGEPRSMAVAADLLNRELVAGLIAQLTSKLNLERDIAEEVAQGALASFMFTSLPVGVSSIDWFNRVLRTQLQNNLGRRVPFTMSGVDEAEVEADVKFLVGDSEQTPTEEWVDLKKTFEVFASEQPKHAELLDLVIRGFSPKEIAEVFGQDPNSTSSIKNIRNRIHNARIAARRYFIDYAPKDTRGDVIDIKVTDGDESEFSVEELTILEDIHTIASHTYEVLRQSRLRIEERPLADPRLLFSLSGD